MKKSALALAATLIGIYTGVQFYQSRQAEPLHQKEIIAHRAGTRYWPENTLYGIEQSIAAGIDGVEFDVHLTRDGHMVIIHDETVDRTTNGSGRVDAHTLFALRELDAGYDWQNASGEHTYQGQGLKIPIVEEVLDLAPYINVLLDIKDYTPESLTWLCEQIRSRKLEQQVWLGRLGYNDLPKVRQICGPDIVTNIEVEELASYGPSWGSVVAKPYVYISSTGDDLTKLSEIKRQADKYKIPIYVGFVEQAETAKALLELGIGGIMTEEPVVIMRELGLIDDDKVISHNQ